MSISHDREPYLYSCRDDLLQVVSATRCVVLVILSAVLVLVLRLDDAVPSAKQSRNVNSRAILGQF